VRQALLLVLVIALLSTGCGGSDVSPLATPAATAKRSDSSPPSSRPVGSDTTPGSTASPSSDTASPEVPSALPTAYPSDVPAAEVPVDALVPAGAEVTGTWYASTSGGDAIVVAWLVPGTDPLRLARGLAVWRRFPDAPSWRPVFGFVRRKTSGVLGIEALTADVTGDGSEDALVFESTGGSGGCGTYRVLDLAVAVQVFARETCDTRVDPSRDPVGLTVTEAVFHDGDAHCCPSATRRSVLTYAGSSGWQVASTSTTPN
jgi:hypothetical protein